MHILIITPGYPYNGSNVFPFVRQTAESLADLGQKITVLKIPARITASLYNPEEDEPFFIKERTRNGSYLDVYRISNNTSCFYRAKYDKHLSDKIEQIINSISTQCNINAVYAHFWDTAYYVSDIIYQYKIPLFIANGESQLDICKYDQTFLKSISGVICVSSKCRMESVNQGYITNETPTIVLPNAVDTSLFYPRDKYEAREKMGFSKNDFIVVFVGLFIRRKGANRVSEAISLLNIPDLKSIFIGNYTMGDKTSGPSCKGVLFEGNVCHDKIPQYLACADVFCLPTLNEGCSNAIVEALACGLPVISSKRSFNDDILTDENSIRVNPVNIQEISNAIFKLYHDKSLCKKMSLAASKSVKKNSISQRAKRIIDFITT